MSTSTLIQKREELAAKQGVLAEVVSTARQESGDYDFKKVTGHGFEGDMAARVERFKALNTEVESLYDEVKGLAEIDDIATRNSERAKAFGRPEASHIVHPGSENGSNQGEKSLGELFIESKAYTERQNEGRGPESEMAFIPDGMQYGGIKVGDLLDAVLPYGGRMKTTMTTAAGWAPQSIRTGRMVESAQRPVQILDFIPSTTTTQAAVVYMEETTYTSNAAETAENATYPEAALAYTERTSNVRKIADSLPVTDEQLEDIPQIAGIINNRLTFMLRTRLDSQVVNGNGAGSNLTGLLNAAGLQTQAKGADPTPDAVYKAMTLIRQTGRATPDLIALNANDWQDIRLLRTADGIYIYGSPADDSAARMWGLPVVVADQLTAGTGLVGSFAAYCELAFKRNVTLKVGYNTSDFVNGRQTVRADLRAAFVTYRGAAFCQVTGI